jgi:hypothetical protein
MGKMNMFAGRHKNTSDPVYGHFYFMPCKKAFDRQENDRLIYDHPVPSAIIITADHLSVETQALGLRCNWRLGPTGLHPPAYVYPLVVLHRHTPLIPGVLPGFGKWRLLLSMNSAGGMPFSDECVDPWMWCGVERSSEMRTRLVIGL